MRPFKHSFLFVIFYIIWRCQSIQCSYQTDCGPCSSNGECLLNCAVTNYQCQNSLLTCKDSEDCDIDCKGSFTGNCQGATIDASTAINVVMDCDWTDSCKSSIVHCGTGNCRITCDQQMSCQDMVVDARNAHNLQINCWLTNSCNGIDVQCGDGDCYMNCGGSKNGQDHCKNMKLKCGTGDCRINCADAGYRQCDAISVNTTLAQSFTCIGGTTQCSAAPPDFTSAPTTLAPTTTTSPTTSIPTTRAPTTSTPTTDSPTITTSQEALVSMEIPIIAGNVTNVTIKDTLTEIINEYLQTHLSVNVNFSLSVDVIKNKVMVTISIDDNYEFDESHLIAYVKDALLGTDIQIVEKMVTTDMETTEIKEFIQSQDDNGMSGAVIAVIVIVIIFVIVLLVAGIFWYRQNKIIYRDKSVIRGELNELQMNEQHRYPEVKPVGAVNEKNAVVVDNDDSLDELNTERSGEDEGDDTDILHEINKTIGDGDDNNDMIIEDETIGQNDMDEIEDPEIMTIT